MNITWSCPICKRTEKTSPNVQVIDHVHGKEQYFLISYKKPRKLASDVTTKSLKKDVWSLFSEYVRRSEADENGYCKCVTCGAIRKWNDGDAGHFIHGTSFLIPEIVHFQCKPCNGFGAGMAIEYKAYMIEKYGQAKVDELTWKAKKISLRLSIFDLEQYKKLYTEKLKELN